MSEPRARPSDVTVRLADPEDPADSAGLCDLFARTTMEADLELAVERSPDFFGLYRLQRLTGQRVFVAEVEGRIEGVATFLAREAWVAGERARVGYLGDLRLSPKLRGGFFFGRRFGKNLRECFEEAGVDVALTGIIRSNELAIRYLTRRSKRFADQPIYRPWSRFAIHNVHFTRRRRPRRTGVDVHPATEADLPRLAAFLAEDQRRRPFGYPLDEAWLRHRLDAWPGLTIESFLLAERGGELVGCVAPWDAGPVKRFRVEAYRGSMRWVRTAFNVGAFVLRYQPLPPVGEVLPYVYLTHVAVGDGDLAAYTALIDAVYARTRGKGYAFFSVYAGEGDPLNAALARYQATGIPAQLFTVALPGTPWADRDPGPGRPGFEMALV